MYSLNKCDMNGSFKSANITFDGIMMGSKNKTFNINGMKVKNILIVDKLMANSFVMCLVSKKYNKLIDKLMLLLTSDDDTGESFREALNIIEKFRLEIKIKYRKFLEKKVLKQMALQLKQLQKEAENRFLELQNYYSENMENSKSGKSR